MTVWAVVYGNYEPPEVLALYDNEQAAHAHVDDAAASDMAGEYGACEVVPMTVRSSYLPP